MTQATKPTVHHDTNPDRTDLDQDARLDKELEETFPASDAATTGGVTKIGNDGEEKGAPKHENH